MKKIIFVFILFLLTACADSEEKSDFEFSLTYNVNGYDKISTYDNRLRLDSIEGLIEIDLVLSQEDKESIKEKILELSILEESYNFKKYNSMEPCGIYNLKVLYDDREYNIHWTSNNMLPFTIDPDKSEGESIIVEEKYKDEYRKFKNLGILKSYIIDIIYKYEEVKDLPEHKLYL